MKRVVWLCAAFALLVLPAISRGATTLDRAIPLDGQSNVRIDVNGAVHVVPGTGNSVHVHVDNYGPSTPPLRVDTVRERGRIHITISGPNQSVIPIGASGIAVDITAPRNVKLDLRAFGGAIHVDRVTAPMQLYASNGAIAVDASDAPLTAYSEIGDVTVADARGMVELTCGRGNASATLAPGWRGNLVRMESSQGNLTLDVPPGFRARYDVTTGQGKVTNPEASVAHAPLVFMLTQKGDITIKERLKS